MGVIACGGQLGRFGFQDSSQHEHIGEVVEGHIGDDGAAASLGVGESIGNEFGDGFSHGGAGNAEALRQFYLGEHGAGR